MRKLSPLFTRLNLHVVCLLSLIPVFPASAAGPYAPQSGDLVFQISRSAQAKAVRLVTGATYTHVGIVFIVNGEPRVLEAGNKGTHYSSLASFAARGEGQRYIAKRLKSSNAKLTPATVDKLRALGEKHIGTPYDRAFDWSDEAIYCTELVWKVYQRALNVELGKLRTLGEFNLSDPLVQKMLAERYGSNIPLQEKVIAPNDLFTSDQLETVFEGT